MLESLLVSSRALSLVPRRARHRILKKAVKIAEIKQAERAAGDWSNVLLWLDSLRSHLDKFTSKLAEDAMEEMNDEEIELVNRLELTAGNTEQIIRLIVKIIADKTSENSIR